MITPRAIKNSPYFCAFLILSLLHVTPDMSLANPQKEDVAGELALVDSIALNYTDSSVVPQPFSVCFHEGRILISDPKLTDLFAINQGTLEPMPPFPISLGNHSLQRGWRELAINPVTQELAIPGEHSDTIALLALAIDSLEAEDSQQAEDSQKAEASGNRHKRSTLTFKQSLSRETPDIPSSFKNPYHACYDHSGQVLLVSSRLSSELTAFIKVNGNPKWQYWRTIKIPAGSAPDDVIIIASQSSNAFYLALNEREEPDHYRTLSTVYKLEFNLNNPGSGLDSGEWGQWFSPAAVDSSHTTERLRGITGMTFTPDGQFLVVVAHGTDSVLFYQKHASREQWQPSATFTNDNLQEADSFDGVHSVISAIPVNDVVTCVYVSSSQHIHSFVWDSELSKWQHLEALLIKHKGRSPGLTGVTIDPEDNRTIIVIGSMTGTVHKAQFSSAPRFEHPIDKLAYDENDASNHQFVVGPLIVIDPNKANAGDLSHLTASVLWKEHTNCPFYWEENQILYRPDCEASLSDNHGWLLWDDFSTQVTACNQSGHCSTTFIVVQVTPLNNWKRPLKLVGVSLAGLTLLVGSQIFLKLCKLINRRGDDSTSEDPENEELVEWKDPLDSGLISPQPEAHTINEMRGECIELKPISNQQGAANHEPSEAERLTPMVVKRIMAIPTFTPAQKQNLIINRIPSNQRLKIKKTLSQNRGETSPLMGMIPDKEGSNNEDATEESPFLSEQQDTENEEYGE